MPRRPFDDAVPGSSSGAISSGRNTDRCLYPSSLACLRHAAKSLSPSLFAFLSRLASAPRRNSPMRSAGVMESQSRPCSAANFRTISSACSVRLEKCRRISAGIAVTRAAPVSRIKRNFDTVLSQVVRGECLIDAAKFLYQAIEVVQVE